MYCLILIFRTATSLETRHTEQIRFWITFSVRTANTRFRRKATRSGRGNVTGGLIKSATWSNAFFRSLSGFAEFPPDMINLILFSLPLFISLPLPFCCFDQFVRFYEQALVAFGVTDTSIPFLTKGQYYWTIYIIVNIW